MDTAEQISNQISQTRFQAGFGVSLVPNHTHNGIDSPKISSVNFAPTISKTWGSGNTLRVVDAQVGANSFIVFMYATPPNGRWSVVPARGSFTITSSDAENAAFAFKYKAFST